ncbi:hypothetical protein XENORESO_018612 [Xenotaenia resolanae]|uniref:Uncharacterized protein n=1 Tax=Xenotaenia resolanae TaxID=208358 RepID=A0ABV0X9A0_9TELE
MFSFVLIILAAFFHFVCSTSFPLYCLQPLVILSMLYKAISQCIVFPQAFSAYYFTQKYIKEITNITLTSPSRAVEAAKLICNMTMAKIIDKTKAKEKYMKNICTMSSFVQVLLTNGYHFDEASYPSISFREKAGGASVGWALGYMLNVSNEVPAEGLSMMKALPSGSWAGIIFLFVVFVFFALVYGVVINRNRTTRSDII